MALVKDGKTIDYIVGFADLGNSDDFDTEMLEWRIARAAIIDYSGDLLVPPQQTKKKHITTKTKASIRDSDIKDDSDDEDW